VAKSTKHQDKIGTLENFRAPWETESGEEVDVNKTTLKRLLFNLKLGEAKAQDAADDAKADLATAETERDEAKEQAANANPAEAQKQIDRLTQKVADLTAERDGLVKAKEHADLRAEVIGDLDPKYAKYVQGEDREALEKSLADVKADFGIESGDGDEGDEDEENPLRSTPRARKGLRNGPDPESGRGGDEVDFDKVADSIIGGGRVFG
jgi:hypothetical protein